MTHLQNPYLPHSLRTGVLQSMPAPKNAPPITLGADGMPVGTSVQVMAWVGDDPTRAEQFLQKEQSESRPRVSLVSNLKAVLKRHEIVLEPPAPPVQLAPQIDVIPAERADVIQGEVVTEDGPINQLEVIRARLGVEGI